MSAFCRLITIFLIIGLPACSSLFFYPSPTLVRTPSDIGLSYQDVYINTSAGVRLHGWWLPAKGEAKGTIYFLHGNAQNISTHLASAYWLPKHGYQVFLLDYRGYGLSTGTPNIPGIHDDIYAGFSWLNQKQDARDKPLYLFGQSLGAVLAAYSATQHNDMLAAIDAIILDAPFSSFSQISKDVAARSWLTWPLQYPVYWLMSDKYSLINNIDKISPTKLLLMHSKQDEVIPYYQAKQLFNAAKKPKLFYPYRGKHISIFESQINRKFLLDYLESIRHH